MMTTYPQEDSKQLIEGWPYSRLTLRSDAQGRGNCIGIEPKAIRDFPSKNTAKSSFTMKIAAAISKKNWILQVSGKSEAVLCADFCNEVAATVKNLDLFWETVSENSRIHFIIPFFDQQQFAKTLPPCFAKRPYTNVHLVAVLGNSPDNNALRIETLRKTPANSRGLWVGSNYDPAFLEEQLTGFDFIIATATQCEGAAQPSTEGALSRLREECAKHGVAFVPIPPAADNASGEEPLVLSYPFAAKQEFGSSGYGAPSAPPLEICDTEVECKTYSTPANMIRRKTGRFHRHSHRTSRPCLEPDETRAQGRSLITADPSPPTSATPLLMEPADVTIQRLEQFRDLHGIVREGIRANADAGYALIEIREDELWREGGHRSWSHYCESIQEASRSYVNRLISHAVIIRDLRASNPPADPDGKPILPVGESLSRPLKKLPGNMKRAKAWRLAVKRADGMPTAKIVSAVVNEILTGGTSTKPSLSRSEKRLELIKQILEVANARTSWDAIAELVVELQSIN